MFTAYFQKYIISQKNRKICAFLLTDYHLGCYSEPIIQDRINVYRCSDNTEVTGKQVRILRGPAAVMEERYLRCHCTYVWEG